MIEKLKRLGLTSYESRAYLALLKIGVAEADEIAMNAKIPVGRVYNVLSNLEELRLVHSQDTRPKKFMCVDPSVAMEKLSKNKLEELRQSATEIEILVKEMTSELSDLKEKKHSKDFWTVAVGTEAHELIREGIMSAEKELLFFVASRIRAERIRSELMRGYFVLINAIKAIIDKGVKINVILNKDVDFSLIENIPEMKDFFEHLGCELNCRLADIPITPFDVIDGKSVMLHIQNPINPTELFAVISLNDPKLAGDLRKKFFAIWETAEPFHLKTACDIIT